MTAPAALTDAMSLVLRRARVAVRKLAGVPAVEDLRVAIAQLDAVAVDQAIVGWSESQRPVPAPVIVRNEDDELLTPEQQRVQARGALAAVDAAGGSKR